MSWKWLRSKIEDVSTSLIGGMVFAFGVGLILAIWALVQSIEAPVVVAVFVAGAAGTFDVFTAIGRIRADAHNSTTPPVAPTVWREPIAVMHEGIRWV